MNLTVLRPDKLGRLYHNTLYERMVNFAQLYTKEFPCEGIIEGWLQRFYANDPTIFILVDQKDGVILGHVLAEVQHVSGHNIVICHQAHSDHIKKGKAQKDGFAEILEHIDKLAAAASAHCAVIWVEKNAKVYEELYGYKTARTMLVKHYGGDSESITDTS